MFGAPGRAWGSSLWWRPGNQETCSLMASSLAPSGCCPSNLCCSLAFRCPGGGGRHGAIGHCARTESQTLLWGPGNADSNDLIQRVVAHTLHKGFLGRHLVHSFRLWDLLEAFGIPSGGLGHPHGPILVALGFRLASANPIQVEI